MKKERGKRVKLQFSIVKFANLWRSCCRRCHAYLLSLIFFLSLLCFFKKYTKVHAAREAQLYLWCLDQYVLAYLTIILTFSSSKELLNCIMEKNDLVSYFSERSCLDGSAITLLLRSVTAERVWTGMGGGIISERRRRHSVGESVGIVPRRFWNLEARKHHFHLVFFFLLEIEGFKPPWFRRPRRLCHFFSDPLSKAHF